MTATVVLTQPASRAGSLAAVLASHGIAAVGWPMTEIDEAPGLDAGGLARALAGCRWALFASPAAIDVTMGALARAGQCWPAGTGIGLIGPGSRDALEGWDARLDGLAHAERIEPLAPPYDADALLARPELATLDGVGVAVLRRADGREAWLQALHERGATLHALSVYAARDTLPPAGASGWLAAAAAADAPVAFSIASADAGARLAAFVRTLDCAAWALSRPVLTQHPRIAQALRAQGWTRVTRHRPGAAGLVAAIESWHDA
ncbi:MAG: uroporphyrinogen-III synthase [Burkholderiaceae bacterium]|jgi:uroporphyrinogen-III synthase|nr:uroporphyrinogen-III synthase [Burkholderiales bacterium]MCZ8338161.1 uroporphyrinogen-III synthase [Burkholderiaceae bacterium]